PGVEDDLLQACQVFVGFVGRGDVRFADNFDQRHSTPVQVDGRGVGRTGKALVQALARILFEMNPSDADLLCRAVGLDFNGAVLGQGLVVLRNLITLGQI